MVVFDIRENLTIFFISFLIQVMRSRGKGT